MKTEEEPEFQPGFRFSRFDTGILLGSSLLAIGVATWQPLAAVVVIFVLGHFFLFCNVFRIARVPELIWAAGFFLAATLAMLSDHPGRSWLLAFGLSAGLAFVLIA